MAPKCIRENNNRLTRNVVDKRPQSGFSLLPLAEKAGMMADGMEEGTQSCVAAILHVVLPSQSTFSLPLYV